MALNPSRDHMLARIRAGLGQSRAQLAEMAARTSHTPPLFVHPPQQDLPAQFATELAKLEGYPHRCADNEDALDAIRDILLRHQAGSVVAWDHAQIGLPGFDALLASLHIGVLENTIIGPSRAEQLGALEPAPICISGVDAGIAETGTLVLRSGPGRGRLASLIAPVHIAVLRHAQIVRGLGAALALLGEHHGPDLFRDSSNLTLITGPSRTGDIELTLTLGVHGPREIHVVLID